MDLIGSFSWIPYILRLVYYTKYIVKKAHKWQQRSKMCCTNPYPNLSHNSLDQLSISLIFHNNLPKFLNLLQNSFWPLSLLLEKIFLFFFFFGFDNAFHQDEGEKTNKVTWHVSGLCQAGIPFVTVLGTWGIVPPTCTLREAETTCKKVQHIHIHYISRTWAEISRNK